MTAATMPLGFRGRHPGVAGATGVVVVAGGCGLLGWVAALTGMKGTLAGLAGIVFVAALVMFKPREEIILATAVLSSAAMFHKTFGSLADVSSGPPSVYVTTFDVMIGLLWFSWFVMDPYGLAAELRAAVRRRILYLPLVAAALMLPSVLVAEDSGLAIAELVRMTSMYLLFLFIALRVRTRVQVWVVVGALGAIGLVEAVIVLGQKLTTSTLGLSVFGTPTILHDRYDGVAVARPFGTLIHPVFMGAFVGAIALLAYSVAVNQRAAKVRLLWLGISAVSVTPLILSNTRAASLGIVVSFVVTTVAFMVTGRLSGRVVATGLVLALIALVPAWGYVSGVWNDSFHTDHFDLEWKSRMQLNELAIEMFEDAPIVGHGLNNFEYAMPRYDRYGLIFADNPVHNLYLLQLAETGVLGFAGVVIMGVGFFARSLRVARTRDRLLSAVGFGVASVFVFWAVEETLVFSLRQDHPRALYFLLAGLVVACGRIASLEPSRPPDVARRRPSAPTAPGRVRRNGARARRRRLIVPIVAVLVVFCANGIAAAQEVTTAATYTGNLKIVFQAQVRGGDGTSAIYVANGDGSDVRRVSPDDGRDYNWPTWAPGGTKILYTARPAGAAGQAEQIYIADADGTDEQRLTQNPWRNAQPKMSPDGRTVVFTSLWQEYPVIGIYALDLATLQVRNLSAVTQEPGAVDGDPDLSPDGRQIVFSGVPRPSGGSFRPTEVSLMNIDGSNRRIVTHDAYYDTDPALSPDGGTVAASSYRGEGDPRDPNSPDPFQVKLQDFRLVTHAIANGSERELTRGLPCAERSEANQCAPADAPAYVPSWTPDGAAIGYVGILSNKRTCICVVDRATDAAYPVIERTDLEISWFDWTRPGRLPPGAVTHYGEHTPSDRLLFSAIGPDGERFNAVAMPDRWGQLTMHASAGTGAARWSADRSRIVTAVLVDPSKLQGDYADPPPGEHRHRHFTLDFMRAFFKPVLARAGAEAQQIKTFDGTFGAERLVTTPWTEDWRDAIPDGERRGNTMPDISRDGRYIVFTNVSSATGESLLLRLDTQTGDVLNLTNATAGAVPVADAEPRFSPDASAIAFTSADGETSQIALVDRDGYRYRQLTDDDYLNIAPAWSPDGRYIVYSSYRGHGLFDVDLGQSAASNSRLPIDDWYLVRIDVRTGAQKVLTSAADSPTFQPVYSPDGDQIAFISLTDPGQSDIYVIDADGGRPRPLQVTQLTQELFVDWK